MANIYEAMSAILVDVDAIGKNQKNQQQGFRFRGIDDVYNTVHPIFARHGVFTVPTVIAERSEERTTNRGSNLIYRILTIKYTFYATDGSCFESVVIGEGMDSGDKAANKAMAVAHKYALLQALCIPTIDMVDPDSESHQVRKKQGPQEPNSSDKARPGVTTKVESVPILSVGNFNVRLAWNEILELCDGHTENTKKVFERFGATSSRDITYSVYKKVHDFLVDQKSSMKNIDIA
ncbi:single-stranded DNA-binding protein [Sphaerochaeta halotolerans]|uniref:Single-stranded DNA-binding protein n=1 Tax=Sphaerochaeta halotolerans TaxID=2293840 RepID=A0A372MH07_9SPIR|nr:ERF family protein [Sphaerochaeta halotolerans]RFU95065.1 single-stranded DNA-binding protein [Sphaerochaeta halotolerans]